MKTAADAKALQAAMCAGMRAADRRGSRHAVTRAANELCPPLSGGNHAIAWDAARAAERVGQQLRRLIIAGGYKP